MWTTKDGSLIRMEPRARGVNIEAERSIGGGTGPQESGLRERHSGLRDGRHESDRNRMGGQSGRHGLC